ncbi:MAG: pirin family protein [Bacteroidota bacterium]|nr:pirin family protein [Bacteroidota bacterium]
MIQKIDLMQKYGNSHISILYPGHALGLNDSGIGSIGRIDQADIHSGTTIKMHPHINDEILSYFRVGKAIHTDSAGITETISRKKLMLMKAGKVFYHEEKIVDRLEGLQIFIRPMTADYVPQVLFYDLENEDSINTWRLLASNQDNDKLNFTSETEIFDITINNNQIYNLPETQIKNAVFILYTFQGSLKVNDTINLGKGECVIFDETKIHFTSETGAEVVLFVSNKDQNCFKQGMFSGNQV